jgi:hypothetical protein
MNEHKNADRFTGFADVYENARPEMPKYLTKIICKYLGKNHKQLLIWVVAQDCQLFRGKVLQKIL